MTFEEWSVVLGALLSIGLAAAPWMFKVHAKLAVIASKIVDMCEQMERASDEHRRLWTVCARNQARLDTHDVQLSHVAERMRQL